jgi:tRNA(fMet)-specific endonuclease VapC
MGILLDSSILIALERNGKSLASRVAGREAEGMFLSVISASELLHGVHRATTAEIRAKRLAFVEAILKAIPILEIDLATARSHAQLWSQLVQKGEMIGVHDSWLAATCLAHGLTLVTGNIGEFRRVPGLAVEEWR